MDQKIIDVIDAIEDPLIEEHNLLVKGDTRVERSNLPLVIACIAVGGVLIAGLRRF